VSIDPHLQTLFREVALTGDASVSRQITNKVRELILRGDLPYATKLPSMHEIAELMDTNYFTVQSALTPLVEEGLLERKRRVGTFVRWKFSAMSAAGIYLPEVILTNRRKGEFQRVLFGALQNLLSAQGTQIQTWIDHRPRAQRGTPLPELIESIEKRRIEFLYVVHCEETVQEWVGRLPLPTVAFTELDFPNRVYISDNGFFDKATQALAQKGITECALITAQDPPSEPVNGVRFPAEFTYRLHDPLDTSGYQLTQKFCKLSKRPKALVVYPDIAASGVVAALLQSGIKLPDDLYLVLHKSRGVPIFHPFAATHIVMDTMKVAETMESMSRRVMQGQGPLSTEIEYLIQHVASGTADQEFLLHATRGSERIRLFRPATTS